MESRRLEIHHGEIPKSPDHIRFVCLSDTHNRTKNISVPAGDVILHSGDFSNAGDERDIIHFKDFLNSLSHSYKIVIAGNHDLSFDIQNQQSLKRNFGNLNMLNAVTVKKKFVESGCCYYLEDSLIEVFGYKIWGSPWTPTFYDWGFNLDRGINIKQKWDLIPEGIDILLTHGPPHGILDKCSDGFRAGCEELIKKVREVNPIVHLFGHIHEGYGTAFDGGVNYINGSTCDLRYRPNQQPFVFDLPRR